MSGLGTRALTCDARKASFFEKACYQACAARTGTLFRTRDWSAFLNNEIVSSAVDLATAKSHTALAHDSAVRPRPAQA
jgi:hypothetical protein